MVHRARGRVGRAPAGRAVRLTDVPLYLVRHGRAAAGWDDDPDPPLDAVGRKQAEDLPALLAARAGGALPVVSSPLRRCRETAAPLAAAWGVPVVIEPAVAEIPSPEGVPMGQRVAWLRAAMSGTWDALGPRYTAFRDGVVSFLQGLGSLDGPTVVVSHFVAINAAIGAAIGDDRLVVRSLDNCSVTVLSIGPSGLQLIEGGHEADTLIR